MKYDKWTTFTKYFLFGWASTFLDSKHLRHMKDVTGRLSATGHMSVHMM